MTSYTALSAALKCRLCIGIGNNDLPPKADLNAFDRPLHISQPIHQHPHLLPSLNSQRVYSVQTFISPNKGNMNLGQTFSFLSQIVLEIITKSLGEESCWGLSKACPPSDKT